LIIYQGSKGRKNHATTPRRKVKRIDTQALRLCPASGGVEMFLKILLTASFNKKI